MFYIEAARKSHFCFNGVKNPLIIIEPKGKKII